MKFFTDLWAFLMKRNENAWFCFMCSGVNDEDISNSVKDHSGRRKATITISATMQVERWLSAWTGGRNEPSQAPGHSFSWSYTYACFTLGILAHVTSWGLTPGDLYWWDHVRRGTAWHLSWQAVRADLWHWSGPSCSPGCRRHPGYAGRIWYCNWHGKGFFSAPTFSCTWYDYVIFLKKVEVQADAIPCATFKFGSMQTHMQARHGPGDLGCCQGNTAYLRGSSIRQLHNCSPEIA